MSTSNLPEVIEMHAREGVGRLAAKKLRAQGRIPVNFYGAGGPAVSLSMSKLDMENILKVKRKVLKLGMPGGTHEFAIFKEITWDAMQDHLLHVDLIRVPQSQKLAMPIALRLDGFPKGVRAGGTAKQSLWELRIKVQPHLIPVCLPANIADLGVGSSLKAGDVALPEGAELITAADAVVIAVEGAVQAVGA